MNTRIADAKFLEDLTAKIDEIFSTMQKSFENVRNPVLDRNDFVSPYTDVFYSSLYEDFCRRTFVAPQGVKSLRETSKEKIVVQFTRGDCWWLAWELHKLNNWPVYVLVPDEYASVGDYWLHAVVKRDDGKFVDVQGFHDHEDLEKLWHDAVLVRMTDWDTATWQRFVNKLSVWNCKNEWNTRVDAAFLAEQITNGTW